MVILTLMGYTEDVKNKGYFNPPLQPIGIILIYVVTAFLYIEPSIL